MRPQREVATNNGQTYFVTSNTAARQCFFRNQPWVQLFVDTLLSYRPERFELHALTVMPDHFHVFLTPAESLEKAIQFIKGGFSFRAKKDLQWRGDNGVAGFSDHRIRDWADYQVHLRYIERNAVKARIVERAEEYAWCSANGRFEVDAFPRRLKPGSVGVQDGAAKAAPFQSKSTRFQSEGTPFQSEDTPVEIQERWRVMPYRDHIAKTLALTALIAAPLLVGCGGGGASSSSTTPAQGAVTPAVSVVATPSVGVTNAQVVSVNLSVTASLGTPAGTVVLSSGSYASFATTLSNGQATVSIPAGLLATGTDVLTATFTPANAASYTSASGTTSVTITNANAAAPVVTATSQTYSTAAYGAPFRALPLANGEVLVSVTAATSGIVAFTPAAAGGLQLSCFNYVRSQFVTDGASDMGMNLTPNGLGLAASLGVDGAIFYNLSTLETCNSTGVQVSQGAVAANEGTFDVVMSPDGKYAFVANEYGYAAGATTEGNIGVVALTYDATGVVMTGTLLGQISTGGQAIAGVTISPDGNRLYVTSEIAGAGNTAAGSSNAILTSTNCVQQTGGTPQANGLLTVIDVAKAEANPSAAAIIATVNAGCSPVRMVETADESTLWVSARGDNRVLAFSTGMLELSPANALLGYAATGGTAPVGLRLLDGGKLLAVANSNRFGGGVANATVLSIAVPAAANVVQTIATGLFPREITVGSDGLTLYLTNYNSQTLQVISTKVQ